jgi:hypothetical protein
MADSPPIDSKGVEPELNLLIYPSSSLCFNFLSSSLVLLYILISKLSHPPFPLSLTAF